MKQCTRSARIISVGVFSIATLAGCGGGGGGYGGSNMPPTPPPPTPPTISVAAPAAASVNRTATLTATVTAAAGVTRVEFLVDGTVVGMTSAAPYTFAWDTSAVSDGAHAVTARVTDASNAVVTSSAASVTVNNHPKVSVTLSPSETFPLPTSTATGTGELTFDLTNGAVTGGFNVTGINATLAHIHRGYAGTAGPVIVNFVKSAADPTRWEPQTGGALTADQINELLAGKLYLNVHSAAYPQGEIRGQIQPENIDVVFTAMNGTSVSPPVTTTAAGIAATTLDTQASNATVHVNTSGVDDATEAHVHKAAAGANATTALFGLTKDAASPRHWSAEVQPVTAADRTDLSANGWYVDVHTPANPAGAIRGQISPTAAPPSPPPPPSPAAATLTQIQGSVFSPVCSGCHNGQGTNLPGVMNLTSAGASFAALVNVASRQQPAVLRVAPNSADASYLVRKVEGVAGINGQRMPLGGPFLDQATIDQIKSWINAGAQNN